MYNIPQPLRFYEATSYQLVNRHTDLGYKNFVPLVADSTHLIPFMLNCPKADATENPVTTCDVINYKTGTVTSILANMSFYFYFDDTSSATIQYIFYDGTSTITALNQGIYYLHIASADEDWYSELFKIGAYNTVSLQFRHSYSFSYYFMPSMAYYKATYEGHTFDSGEYQEYSESNKQEDNYDIYTYRRSDKLRTLVVWGDSNVIDALKAAQFCDTITLTDEISKTWSIEIMEVSVETVSRSNYMSILVKYRVLNEAMITVNKTLSTLAFLQTGASVIQPTEGLTFNGMNLTFDGENWTFN